MKNTFVKVLSFVMALMMVVGAFSTLAVFAADCTHANAVTEVIAPTCKNIGYTKNTCPDCGEEWISNPVAKIADHDYSVYVPAKDADCENPAMTDGYKCSICGDADPDRAPAKVDGSVAKGHVFHEKVVVAATCEKDGYTTLKCARCNFVDHKGEFCAKCGLKADKCTCKFCDTCNKPVDECECENETTATSKPTATKTAPTAKGHKLVYTVVDKANASKCESGLVRVTCSACDYTYDIVEENKHDWKPIKGATIDRTQDPFKQVPEVGTTCDYTYKAGEYCTICGATQKLEANDVSTHKTMYTHRAPKKGEVGYGTAHVNKVLGETVPANMVTAEILAMSWDGVAFGVGTKTTKASNCNEKGYRILYCIDCEKYVLSILDEKACAVDGDEGAKSTVGNWVTADDKKAFDSTATIEDINKTEYRCVALTRTTTCNECGETVKVETKAAEAHVYDWKDEYDVQQGTVVTPKTCLVNGKTTYNCKYCTAGDYETVEATDVAAGHVWSAQPTGYKDGFDCTDDDTWTKAVIYTCTYENCDADNAATTDVKEKETDARDYTSDTKTHDIEKKTQAATCIADAAYYNACKRCDFVAKYGETGGPTDKPAAGFDANNHVVNEENQDQAKNLLEEGDAANCTEGKTNKYLCACNAQIYVEVTHKLGHNETGVFTDLNYNGKVDDGEIDAAAFAGNCQKPAVAQGNFCTACDTYDDDDKIATAVVTKTSAIGNKVPEVHASTPVDIETVAPTCSAKGYDQKYYSCCGDILKVNYTADVDEDAHDPEYVAEDPATCSAAGTAEHYACKYCDVVFAVEIDNSGSEPAKVAGDIIEDLTTLVIPQMKDADGNPGHKWGTVVAEVPEECAKDGVKAHQICQNCGMYLIEGKVYELTYKDNDPTKEEIVVSAALKIPAHGTKYMGFYKDVEATCTTEGKDYKDGYICSKCDVTIIPATEHKDTVTGKDFNGVYDATTGWTAIVDCTKDCYTEYSCSKCNYKYLDNFKKADKTAHEFKNDKDEWYKDSAWTWDVEDTDLQYACLSGKTFTRACKNCTQTTVEKKEAAKGHVADLNGAEVVISFACNEYDKFLNLNCKYCNVAVTKANAKHAVVDSIVETTCTVDGHIVSYCANGCDFYTPEFENQYFPKTNHANKVLISEVAATITAEGSKTYSCPDCAAVWTETVNKLDAPATFTVTTDATAAVAGTTITVTVDIEATGLAFNVLELTLNDGDFEANDDAVATGFDTDVEVIVGKTIQIYPAVTTETATLGDDNKASITFTATVDQFVADKCTIKVANAVVYVYDEDNEGAYKSTTLNLAAVDAAAVKVAVLGNVNGDTLFGMPAINAADYKEAFNYAKAVTTGAAAYDAKYDINRDGVVNSADAIAIRTFLRSEQNASDYLKMINYDILAESDAHVVDMDKDGDCDEIDEILFVEAILAEIDAGCKNGYTDLFAE